MLTPSAELAQMGFAGFVIYAAVILSFLGGVRWGLELARAPDAPSPARLVYSVSPSVAGWILATFALTSAQLHGAAGMFAGLFALQYMWDRFSHRDANAPDWYPLLRQVLTGGVMLACLALILAKAIGRI